MGVAIWERNEYMSPVDGKMTHPSGKHGDSDKGIYSFIIFIISIITIRIIYHQISLE